MLEMEASSNTIRFENMTDENIYHYGEELGFYYACVFLGNSFTIIMSFIWYSYIFYRSFLYILNRMIFPFLGIEREKRNCGINKLFAKQNKCYLTTEDHTFRERGIRFVGILHFSGFLISIILFCSFGFSYYKDNKNYLCSLQAAIEQMCIWIQMLMFYNYFLWLFIEFCCYTDLNEDGRLETIRKARKKQEKYQSVSEEYKTSFDFPDPDPEEELDEIEGDSKKPSINIDIHKTKEQEQEEEEKRGLIYRIYEDYWKGDGYCCNSISLCCTEIYCYLLVFITVFVMVLIPGLLGQYMPPSDGHRPKWCWIRDFKYQIFFFYGWMFIGMIIIPVFSILIWMKLFFFCICSNGKELTKDSGIRAIGIKVIVYSIVFLFWLVSFFHRLALEMNGQREVGFVAILGGLQGLQMGSYTGVMIIAFFIINFLTMYCDSIISVGICACFRDIHKWGKKRRIEYKDHVYKNKRLEDPEYGYCRTIVSILFDELRYNDLEMLDVNQNV